MDQNLLRSYFATVYELPTEAGVLRVSLDGEIASLPRGSADSQGQFAAPRPVVIPAGRVADLEHGRELYRQNCMVCHGEDGRGGQHGAGAALTDALTVEAIVGVAASGRNAMPAFGRVLRPEDFQDAATYIVEQLAPNQGRTQ